MGLRGGGAYPSPPPNPVARCLRLYSWKPYQPPAATPEKRTTLNKRPVQDPLPECNIFPVILLGGFSGAETTTEWVATEMMLGQYSQLVRQGCAQHSLVEVRDVACHCREAQEGVRG